VPFSDVQFQPIAHERIQQALRSGRVPHAYLFAGRPGVGREMMAARLAQLLLCAAPKDVQPPVEAGSGMSSWRDACGQCEDCRLFQGGGHPDFHRIYRTLNKHHPDKLVQKRKALDLSVDVIRHFVLDCVGLSPSRQRAKVFVISESERLSPSAQNAMLKTLEEPPGQSYLIMIATSADELLPTTQSRCHHVQFNGLPGEFVQTALIKRAQIDPDAARFLAELVQGSLGQAMQYARQGLYGSVPALIESIGLAGEDPLAASKLWQEQAKTIAEGAGEKKQVDAEVEDESAGGDEDDGDDAPVGPETRTLREAQLTMLAILSTILRDVQRVSVGHAPAALPRERKIGEWAGAAPREIAKAIRAVATAEFQIELNASAGLIFDSLAITISNTLFATAVVKTR
jgi:DNA polymerase III delta' subunit